MMKIRKFNDLFRSWRAAAVIAAGAVLAVTAACDDGKADAARFRITDQVINPDLPAVSATLEASGNGARLIRSGGFEPAIWRTMFTTDAASPNRVLANPAEISQFDSLRSGALDGAEVRIYRISDGAFSLVRQDRVAEGGFVAEGWDNLTGGGAALPADTTQIDLGWEPWYRPDARTWFRVRALGRNGALSQPSTAVEARSPPADMRSRDSFKAMRAQDSRIKGGLQDGAADIPVPQGAQVSQTGRGAPRLSWRPVPGAEGYVIERTAIAPEAQRGYYIELEDGVDGPAIAAGDLVFLHKEFREVAQGAFETDRVWDAGGAEKLRPRPLRQWPYEEGGAPWRLRDHAPDTPVSEPGRSYLELDLTRDAPVKLVGEGFAQDSQDFYEVIRPEPYVMEAWVRSDAPGIARLEVLGNSDWAEGQRPAIFRTGPEWTLISTEFQGLENAREARGNFALILDGAGRFGVDNLRIRRAGTPWLDFSEEEYGRLAAAQLSALRTHPLIKTNTSTYDLAQLTDPGGLPSGTRGSNSLPQLLHMTARAGTAPWLQIEPHLSEAEWAGLVEYLAAPADAGPWAAKRAAQGREAPWVDAFDRIWFEIGNETWNGLFQPWVFKPMKDAVTGEAYGSAIVYGLYQRHVIDLLRASPWWSRAGLDDKVTFVLGGWNINQYGEAAARRTPRSALVAMAPYIGGWDADQPLPTGTPENFSTILNWVTQNTLPFARMHMKQAAEAAETRGAPLEVGTYEAGPGFVMNTSGRDESLLQEQVMKSQAAGVATLDNFLALAAQGYRMQNFFTFGDGRRWRSHAEWYDGGQAFPSWKLIALLNREGLGDMLEVQTLSAPGIDLKAARRREAVENAPQVTAYATRQGDRLNLFVMSRRLPDFPAPAPDQADPGCTPVEVALPFASAERVELHRMSGPYAAHNVDADRVGIEVQQIAPPLDPSHFQLGAATGALECGLPPASAFLYVFKGIRD
jgi:hypothetical protein